MSLMRTMGRITASIWLNKEFIAGVMEGTDPGAVAAAVNENSVFMGKVMKDLDPKAMTEAMDEGLEFAAEMLKHMAVALAAGRDIQLASGQLPLEPAG